MSACSSYGHDFKENGYCGRCSYYDADYDEENDDDEMDEDEEDDEMWVDKDWNGRRGAIEVETKWLDRAKALIRELKVTTIEEAYKVAEVMEREKKVSPFDRDVANIIVIALRETETEREIMARRLEEIRAKKKLEPDDPEACGWCVHHADNHNYAAGDPPNVPCTECPDGVCVRKPAPVAPVVVGVRKGQRKKLVDA